jgi:pyruvyltransferase
MLKQSNNARFLKKYLRYIADVRLSSVVAATTRSKMPMYWSASRETAQNFGDALNKEMCQVIFGQDPVNVRNTFGMSRSGKTIFMLGSILDGMYAQRPIICGAGFKYENGIFYSKPHKLISTRGPLSAKIFSKFGYPLPCMNLDPGFMYSKLFSNSTNDAAERRVGIILHYKDRHLKAHFEAIGCETINVLSPVSEILDFICKSEIIASSSLHGLIVGTSFNKKVLWFSGENELAGGDFKFHDAYTALGVSLVRYGYSQLCPKFIKQKSVFVDCSKQVDDWSNNILPELLDASR